jgi:hypothetical protein
MQFHGAPRQQDEKIHDLLKNETRLKRIRIPIQDSVKILFYYTWKSNENRSDPRPVLKNQTVCKILQTRKYTVDGQSLLKINKTKACMVYC